MKRPVRILSVAVIAVTAPLMAIGCGPGANQAAIEDRVWNLQSFGAASSNAPLIDGTDITLKFDSESGEASGTAGCNQYVAQYRIEDKSLTIGELSWTEMACAEPAGVMAQEQNYLSMLQRMRQVTVQEESLTLSGSDEEMTFSADES